MRFAISLLTVICIASVIGTVVRQQEPFGNYVNQFGPFWARVFESAGLYTVYSSWWFLLILAVLVVSTSLCIARNAPRIVNDLRTFKENVRAESLGSFHHKGQGEVAGAPEANVERVLALLAARRWKAKVQARPGGTMIAARAGRLNKVGYLAAHSAIVLICLGGLSDGNLIVRAQMLLQGKSSYTGGGLIRDVAPEHRLPANTPTFRANLMVPEGGRSGTAVINMSDGVVLQDLPFDIELKKFIVDYYDTGMPKLFASEIVIHDRDTGQATEATVKVNEPAFHRGVAIYQSSFDDGGSALKLRAIPMARGGQPFEVSGTVGSSTQLGSRTAHAASAADALTLEFTGLRVINVENLGGASAAASDATPPDEAASSNAASRSPAPRNGPVDVRRVDLASTLRDQFGSGARHVFDKTLRNVGPSVSYKLRDASGQAREYNNYMLPIELDGELVFLAGVREQTDDNFRYLRIPADDQGSLQGWARLRAALFDPKLRAQAAERYVRLATPPNRPEMASQLQATAQRVLALFSGSEPVPGAAAADGQAPRGGLQAISDFMETSVPEGERQRISEVLLRILNGSLFELANLTREQAGEKPMVSDEATQRFMTQAVLSLSDSYVYPAPVLLELSDFTQVQASVFQVTRSPGKTLVYLGCVLLIVGVFSMLYVRERRLWVWVREGREQGQGASHRTAVTLAMSATRRTLDADDEFDRLRAQILNETSP